MFSKNKIKTQNKIFLGSTKKRRIVRYYSNGRPMVIFDYNNRKYEIVIMQSIFVLK
jgi:hypothetical protein